MRNKCQNTGFLVHIFADIRTEFTILCTGKYGLEETRVLAYFAQCILSEKYSVLVLIQKLLVVYCTYGGGGS